MSHYLLYWKPEVAQRTENEPLIDHAASNQLDRVGTGDVLWIVTSEGPDDLVLVGRLRVGRIVGQEQAEHELRRTNLWEARYHAIADSPEEQVLLDISRYAPNLTFDGSVECLPLEFTGKNLQSMRRLDGDGEALMEYIWSRRNEIEGPPAADA